jgi:hypothetical protein
MKMIFTKFNAKPYYFYTTPINSDPMNFRLLSNYELESFRNSTGIKDAKKDNNLEIMINKQSLLSDEQVINEEKKPFRIWVKKESGNQDKVIRNMLDYLMDLDKTTYWATNDYWNTEFEFFLKDTSGRNLNKPLKIRAIYLNTGNVTKPNDYFDTHRIKDVNISFSKSYDGNLGSSKANYNYMNYKISLPDTVTEKMIVFLNPIEATSVRLQITDLFFGTKDELAIYDFNIYLENE